MASEPRLGRVHWVDLSPGCGSEQPGVRLALANQNDFGSRASTTTIVAAITSRLPSAGYPFLVRPPDDLPSKPSVVRLRSAHDRREAAPRSASGGRASGGDGSYRRRPAWVARGPAMTCPLPVAAGSGVCNNRDEV